MNNRYDHIRDIMTNECSGFAFREGCEYELSSFSTYSCSQSEIENKVMRGVIAVSDYFILYSLICLGHATATGLLVKRLNSANCVTYSHTRLLLV